MARLILNYKPEVFIRDICEGYVKGFYTFNELFDLLYGVVKNATQSNVEG